MKKYTKKTVRYYDSIASCYIISGAAVVLENKLNKFAKLLHGKKILDIGCGPGHDTGYLTRRNFDCLGIDLSKEMIKLARSTFKGKFEIMDFLDLKFKDNSFDGIWCSSMFKHVKKVDLPGFLVDIGKVLKKNGVLGIISTQKQKRTKDQDDTRFYVMFSKRELKTYLKKAGYKVLFLEIFPYGGKSRIFVIAKKLCSV